MSINNLDTLNDNLYISDGSNKNKYLIISIT